MGANLNTDSIVLTNEILGLIAEIEEFKGRWLAIGRIAPERLTRLQHVATIESAGSSTRIEGAKLSDRQVEHLLAHLEVGTLASRDEQEVAGYAETMESVTTHWAAIDLTENHLRQLHRDLLKYSAKDERHRGEYKTLPNHVEAFDEHGKSLGIVFETASPFETPQQMADLVDWTRGELEARQMHPLLIIAVFVVVFLAIHPFQDGNGRLSRILTTWLLLRAGYAYVPYASLESLIERSKEAYYLALRQTQGTLHAERTDWEPWLLYFLRLMKRHKDHLETKIERERVLLGTLPELSLRILELAREHGRVTVGETARVTETSRNTVKEHVHQLARQGYLVRHGAGRGTWYSPG